MSRKKCSTAVTALTIKIMSQYNWSWWFVLNLIGIVIGMLIAMVAKTPDELWLANAVMCITCLSFLPCLYIGMKPGK